MRPTIACSRQTCDRFPLLAPHKNIRHQPTSPTTRHFIASIECDDENQPTKTIGVLV